MDAKILNDLELRWVPRGVEAPWLDIDSRKYMLRSPLNAVIDGELYSAPAGYIYDMSSIPRVAHLVYTPGYHEAVRPAVFHDYFYSHLWLTLDKAFADKAFKALMLSEGASPFVAGQFYWAVKLFGRGGWSRLKPK